jgi:hypothetical protein
MAVRSTRASIAQWRGQSLSRSSTLSTL